MLNTTTAAAGNKYAAQWGQSTGQLQIYYSRNWFTAGAKNVSTGCVTAFTTSRPLDKPATGGIAATIIPNATPGAGISDLSYYKSYMFYTTHLMAAFADWVADPVADTTIHKELRNYFITKTSIDGTTTIPDGTTIPATVKIIGKLQITLQVAPFGQYYTIDPSAAGYQDYTTSQTSAGKTSLTCGTADKICPLAFNLYTNCLKWAASLPSTNKTLFNYFDTIFRWLPGRNAALAGNGPNRVIRFVKLFPEAQLFQDVLKRNISSTVGAPFVMHYTYVTAESGTVYASQGNACLVELFAAHITGLGTTLSNTLAVFLFNLGFFPLIL